MPIYGDTARLFADKYSAVNGRHITSEEADYGLFFELDRTIGRILIISVWGNNGAQVYNANYANPEKPEGLDGDQLLQIAYDGEDKGKMIPWVKESFPSHHDQSGEPTVIKVVYQPQIIVHTFSELFADKREAQN